MTDPIPGFVRGVERLAANGEIDAVGERLGELARDRVLLDPVIAQLDPSRFDGRPLHGGEEGVQLLLVHRPVGVMSYTHSHSVWVAFAAVAGVETHEQYAFEHGELTLLESRALGPGDVVTMLPPTDIHSHGHVAGVGDAPYSLVLLGDNQLRFERREFDLETGEVRVLPPGELGTLDRS